jgi:hypothetical protein
MLEADSKYELGQTKLRFLMILGRRLHIKELHNLYTFPYVIRMIKSRRMILAGHVACMGEMRNAYIILVRKPEGKRPHGRSRHRIYVRKTEWECVDWMHLAKGKDQCQALVNTVMNLRVP